MNVVNALDTLFVRKTDECVVSTFIGTGIALLDLRTNEYFTLDPVGAFIWERLQTPGRCADIAKSVMDNYEVDPDICVSEVEAFIAALRDADLIEPAEAGS